MQMAREHANALLGVCWKKKKKIKHENYAKDNEQLWSFGEMNPVWLCFLFILNSISNLFLSSLLFLTLSWDDSRYFHLSTLFYFILKKPPTVAKPQKPN